MTFDEWYYDEFGEYPDEDDECVEAMRMAFYGGMEYADDGSYYEMAEDALLEEMGY